MKLSKISRPFLRTLPALFAGVLAWGQGLPSSGMQYLQTIAIPGWRATGSAGNANVDVMGFNPVTRFMYLADRTNHGVDVIDTRTNVVVGLLQMASNSVPNVPLVAVNLQQLAVSDGLKSVYVWDLKAPQAQPDKYDLPSTTTDGMDYDPINQTVYVITDDAPYYLVGISLPYKKITTQTVLPGSADLIKFNPVDGKIYVGLEDADNNNAGAGVAAYDPATDKITANYKIGPACPVHGIDIDPISNIAVLGCFGGTATGDMAISLADGSVLKTFVVGGTDTIVFNPNNRRFYAGAGLNTAATSGCPQSFSTTATKRTPVVGIFDASGPTGAAVREYAAACTGGGHIAGVDPITNFVYVPVSQYPADPASSSSGQNGVLVFRDSTPPAQAPVTQAQAALTAFGSSMAGGTVQFTLAGRRMRLTAAPTGITGPAAWLSVPTTVTNEFVACAVNPANGTAGCSGDLLGDPLIGSVVTLSVDSGSG
ncbi:MAG: hypothetical protein C5B51_13195, partial [Terriglobia bacterium]